MYSYPEINTYYEWFVSHGKFILYCIYCMQKYNFEGIYNHFSYPSISPLQNYLTLPNLTEVNVVNTE